MAVFGQPPALATEDPQAPQSNPHVAPGPSQGSAASPQESVSGGGRPESSTGWVVGGPTPPGPKPRGPGPPVEQHHAVEQLATAVLERDSRIDSLDVVHITQGGWTPVLVQQLADPMMRAPSLALVSYLAQCGDERALEELIAAGVADALAMLLREDPSEEAVKAIQGIVTGGSLEAKARHSTAIVHSACTAEVLRLVRKGSHGTPLLLLSLLSSSAANRVALCAAGAVEALCLEKPIGALIGHRRTLIGVLVRIASPETARYLIDTIGKEEDRPALELVFLLLEREENDVEVKRRALQVVAILASTCPEGRTRPFLPPDRAVEAINKLAGIFSSRLRTEVATTVSTLLSLGDMSKELRWNYVTHQLAKAIPGALSSQHSSSKPYQGIPETLKCIHDLLGLQANGDLKDIDTRLLLCVPPIVAIAKGTARGYEGASRECIVAREAHQAALLALLALARISEEGQKLVAKEGGFLLLWEEREKLGLYSEADLQWLQHAVHRAT